MKEVFDHLRKKYKVVFEVIRRSLEVQPLSHGHGFDHYLMVAQYCYLLSEDPRIREISWIAGLIHDVHRSFKDYQKVLENLLQLLAPFGLTFDEALMIRDAILNHMEFNDPQDNEVTVILKDADRLANLGPANLFRAGQHMPDTPPFVIGFIDGPHPEQTFRNRVSCRDTLFSNLAWEDDPRVMLRTPKAREIGKKYFDFYRQFLELHKVQCIEVGLVNPL